MFPFRSFVILSPTLNMLSGKLSRLSTLSMLLSGRGARCMALVLRLSLWTVILYLYH